MTLVAPIARCDVSFTPGPGLKKNDDGTYSRTYDAEAEGARAGGGGGEGLPAWQNLVLTAAVGGALYVYANGRAPRLPSLPKRAPPPPPPPASAADVAEARAARLARFTGDGPAKNAAAFADALADDAAARPAAGAPAAAAPAAAAPAAPRTATLGSLLAKEGDREDEFFGGDSTTTYK